MAVYIGVDLYVRTQTVCWMDTADGEIHQRTLDHGRDDVRAFSSGIDLKTLSRGEFPMEWFRVYERGLRTYETMDKVVMAAIHGYCIGGGLQVALASDIRIVSENTQFGLTAVKECLVPGLGTYRLARFIGMGRAKRIILSGEFFFRSRSPRHGFGGLPGARIRSRFTCG